ncbi:unnamed protein product [Closterium sp. Naga37s-1]|nr:unnamed protein product [Closterium sp. Naga37s-1]
MTSLFLGLSPQPTCTLILIPPFPLLSFSSSPHTPPLSPNPLLSPHTSHIYDSTATLPSARTLPRGLRANSLIPLISLGSLPSLPPHHHPSHPPATFMTALQLFPAFALYHGVYDRIYDYATALPSVRALPRGIRANSLTPLISLGSLPSLPPHHHPSHPPAAFMTALQLFPAFALYHGVYELTQSSLIGSYQASQGTLTWATAATNGYLTAVAILAVEWLVFLLLAIYLDQVVSAGSGVRKHPLFFLRGCKSGFRKLLGSLGKFLRRCRLGGDAQVHADFQEGSWKMEKGKEWKAGAAGSGKAEWGEGEVGGGVVGTGQGTDEGGEKEKAKGCLDRFDVDLEKRKVQHLLHSSTTPNRTAHHSILCAGLSKVYPSRDGGAPKEAVAGMWLGVARGECLGVLGPMMGFLQPSGGTAIIEGMGIAEEMEGIYSIMGVCPQHDGGTAVIEGMGTAEEMDGIYSIMGVCPQHDGGTAVIEGMGIAEEMEGIYSIMGVCPQHDGGTAVIEGMGIAEEMEGIYSIMGPPMGAADRQGAPLFLRPLEEPARAGTPLPPPYSPPRFPLFASPPRQPAMRAADREEAAALLRAAEEPPRPAMGAADWSGAPHVLRAVEEPARLTGREHLLFYGRLKNLHGSSLAAAVDASLAGVHLLKEADKPVQQYSGGMKRRLSVAILLIGDPLVVYMDEPSTGLDPSSRMHLWNVVKRAKKNCAIVLTTQHGAGPLVQDAPVERGEASEEALRYCAHNTGLDPSSRMHLWNVVKRAKKHCAIVLTTHSMEEADALCDRMGIFVRGKFACIGSAQELTARMEEADALCDRMGIFVRGKFACIGSAQELTARYGGRFIFTLTTPVDYEAAAARLALTLSVNARRIYNLSGTQKFELPVEDVSGFGQACLLHILFLRMQ